jgi:hypothetical protein
MNAVKFLPWVGARYSDGFAGKRTLILGESHYKWKGIADINQWRSITQTLVQEQCDGHYRKAFWTKTAKAFLGHCPTLEEKRTFWSSVAFYNYVQESAGDAPRIAPRMESWASSQEAFKEVLISLNPDFVLILGYRLAANLRVFLIERGEDILGAESVATYKIATGSGTRCIGYPIKHPSSGFDGGAWHPYIMKALEMA